MAFILFEPSTRPRREPERVFRPGQGVAPAERDPAQRVRGERDPAMAIPKAIPPPTPVEPTVSGEERYVLGLIVLLLATTILPALALFVYLILNPDAFMYAITP